MGYPLFNIEFQNMAFGPNSNSFSGNEIQKTLKNGFLAKSFVTTVFGKNHVFTAEFRSKIVPKIHDSTPLTIMDVSW